MQIKKQCQVILVVRRSPHAAVKYDIDDSSQHSRPAEEKRFKLKNNGNKFMTKKQKCLQNQQQQNN